MFDLLGILDLSDAARDGPLPSLPSEPWHPVAAVEVRAERLRARLLERPFGPPTHAVRDGRSLFVVGDIFRRGRRGAGSLDASTVLHDYVRDPEALLRTTRGNFVLIVVDERAATCDLVASRLSIWPFYYVLDSRRVIFSTSLGSVAACLERAVLDKVAVAEHALFNYPLADRSFVRGVRGLRPAETVHVEHGQIHARRWWDVRSLYDQPLLDQRDALEYGSTLLHAAVNDLASDQQRVRVSFTSGFDSRATLAVLDRDRADILAYAFGIPGSINVSVPRDICAQFGLAFEPIYLDGAYEQCFDEYALRTLLLSDCLSTVERANYPYAFERTAGFSPLVLTGLFGSELLRTFQNIGYIVSSELVKLHLAEQPAAQVGDLVGRTRYVQPRLVQDSLDDIAADIRSVFDARFADLSADQRFYMFLLTEGLRKYFGAETHAERPWGANRFPFLDEEFVEFAFRAPFAGVHARTLKPTIQNRLRSQYFYAYVIRRYRPELLAATTDHGFPPGDLLAPLALLRIGPKVVAQRRRERRSGYREFKTEEWTAALYQRRLPVTAPAPGVFGDALRQDFATGQWLDHRLEFARAASLELWMAQLDGTVAWS